MEYGQWRYKHIWQCVRWLATIGGLLLSIAAAPVHAQITITVANNGVDGANCGLGVNVPCRTITQAIAQANPAGGDKILVGPGLYGDINIDGSLSGPGEEVSPVACDCAVLVNKPVTILSTDGADATVIDSHAVLAASYAVRITASGVVFGQLKKGFIINGRNGLSVNANSNPATSNVEIAGNVARSSELGFVLDGQNHNIHDNLAIKQGVHGFVLHGSGDTVKNNQSVNNTDGFLLSSDSSNHTLQQNEARDNYVGFSVSGSGHQLTKNTATDNLSSGFTGDASCVGVTLDKNVAARNSQYGFDLEGGSGYVLTGNLAGHNFDSGFILAGGNQYILSHNAAVGNYSIGFHLFGGTGHQLMRTAVLGNRDVGILLDTGGTVLISQSNIEGNGTPFNVAFNCGVLNNANATVMAKNNFWGAATGPGADPADAVCGGATVSPFASTPFAITIQDFAQP